MIKLTYIKTQDVTMVIIIYLQDINDEYSQEFEQNVCANIFHVNYLFEASATCNKLHCLQKGKTNIHVENSKS